MIGCVEDVAGVGEQVDLESVAGGDEAGENGRRSPAVVAAEESRHGGISSDGDSPQAALGSVLVNLQVSVLGVAHQGLPVRQGIGDRLCLGAFRQDAGLTLFEARLGVIEGRSLRA